MKIRNAELKDLDSWARMRNGLWPDSTDVHKKEIRKYFDGVSIDIVEALILESEGDQVAGFIELNIRNFAEGSLSSAVPYIEGWYVSEPHRRKGYGKALIAAAENWAREKGYTEIASDTETHNLKSIAIHKRLGFKETERVVCFLKKLK